MLRACARPQQQTSWPPPLSIDGPDGVTDGETDTRPFCDAYRLLCWPRNTAVLYCWLRPWHSHDEHVLSRCPRRLRHDATNTIHQGRYHSLQRKKWKKDKWESIRYKQANNIHRESKKQCTKLLPITSPDINRFSNFFSLTDSVVNCNKLMFK